ncbi:hypothetical protein IU469_30925 [Nocardia puris]|uniref:hypothetical protein n=1 Tax=Nocardia puris TaxID=208602 RepID=UPI001895F456|nr:hypothetical protein [Nocardia puris]MBF6215907.1 hypothetical protein [Nocardia puris]MBF6370088.1 hypothetical protein [Nocardia puris]
MPEYRVVWEIDQDALNPVVAAVKALADQRRTGSRAVVFDVTDPVAGITYRVDLDHLGHMESWAVPTAPRPLRTSRIIQWLWGRMRLLDHRSAPLSYRDCIDAITTQMMAEIRRDIRDGVVPPTVRTFRELHSYVDANMYADDLVTALSEACVWDVFINDATDPVDIWLRAGRPEGIATQHTASSWHESTPIHAGERDDTVPPAVQRWRAERSRAFASRPTVYDTTHDL